MTTAAELRSLALDSADLEGEPVTIEKWGGATYWVRALTAAERNTALMAARHMEVEEAEHKESGFYASIVIAATLDREGGEQVFSQDDLPFLLGKASKNVDALANPILRLSGMSQNDVRVGLQEQVDEAGKDSSLTTNDDSSSK